MAINWVQATVSAIPGIAAAIISAALSARWALARFRSEKWWERKFSTYTDTLRALFLVKRYVDDWIESYEMHEERTEDYRNRLQEDWHVGHRMIEEATVIGSFIISLEAAEVLARLRKAKNDAHPDDPHDQACREAEALDAAIPAFTAAAHRDLGIHAMPR